jgi:serine/threonine protein kinase
LNDLKGIEPKGQEFKEAEPTKKEKKNQIIGFGKEGSIIVKSLHKKGNKEIVVKEISKSGKTPNQIDDIRGLIQIYQSCLHHNVVRLEDWFECKSNFYLCL